jgi:hypothetical protein
MGQVRAFVEADIPQVADLHRRVFHTGETSSLPLQRSYRAYFAEIFLHHPWRDEAMPSLAYEDASGQIVGFLGVVPRPMSIDGRPVRAAVSSQFIVDPERRSTMAGLKLLKTFLSGPQDLSIADEANDVSRKLWEGLGGATALLYSLYWLRLLKPTQFFMSRFTDRRMPAPLTYASSAVSRFIDTVAIRMPQSPFQRSEPSLSGEELSRDTLLPALADFSRNRSVRPEYDERSLQWLLEVIARKTGSENLQKVAVRGASGKIVGWYLYYMASSGMGEVLQIGAEENSIKALLDHLFHDAWRRGATALSGRIEPRFVRQFREKNAQFHHRGSWVLVHSNRPELLQAIHRGDAFLSRLEGEWCMRFRLNGNGD